MIHVLPMPALMYTSCKFYIVDDAVGAAAAAIAAMAAARLHIQQEQALKRYSLLCDFCMLHVAAGL
jgi:hypothetical protein